MNFSIEFERQQAIAPDPLAVSPATPVRDAIRQMARTASSAVLVVENGRLLGILTERD